MPIVDKVNGPGRRLPPQSKFMGLRLDPEIVELIIRLNRAGFMTYESCAGHNARGYIGFGRYNDKAGITKILEAYGLRNIRIEDQIEDSPLYKDSYPYEVDKGRVTRVSFDPIGKSNGESLDPCDPLDYGERRLELF